MEHYVRLNYETPIKYEDDIIKVYVAKLYYEMR